MNFQDQIDDNDGWTPPTEAEMKVILAKRERSDKISKLMGEYLLKGYKMLGISCDVCGTILLRDKHDIDYCVACSELDTDLAKDDPALSDRAASSQVQEGELQVTSSPRGGQEPHSRTASAMDTEANGASSIPTSNPSIHEITSSSRSETLHLSYVTPGRKFINEEQDSLSDSDFVLQCKLRWATQQLKQVDSIEGSIPLCELIKACADALKSVRNLAKEGN